MSLFSGANEATVTGGGVWFEPGRYRVEVEAVKTIKSRKNGKNYFVIECKILESNNADRPVGSKASQVIDITNVMGLTNIKKFVAAASGVDPTSDNVNEQLTEVWQGVTGVVMDCEQIFERVVEDDNPLGGEALDLEVIVVKTKAKQDFSRHDWSPVKAAA